MPSCLSRSQRWALPHLHALPPLVLLWGHKSGSANGQIPKWRPTVRGHPFKPLTHRVVVAQQEATGTNDGDLGAPAAQLPGEKVQARNEPGSADSIRA